MAGCSDCSNAVIITSGDGVTITGSGTPTSPYVVAADELNVAEGFQVRDSTTVDLTLYGDGTNTNPYVLTASSKMRVSDLSDVADPEGGPAAGESLVWVAAAGGVAGHWVFATLPPAPAGSVNVGAGLSGTGAVATPLIVRVSGTWGAGALAGLGSDSTIGQPTYIDSAGVIRVKPLPSTSVSVDWDTQVTGKPSTFTPSGHQHNPADILNQSQLDVGKINGRKITSAFNSTPTPANPSAGDLFFFPKGS